MKVGAVNVTLACPLPAVAVPMPGAPGATAFSAKLCCTRGAGSYVASPAWSALMVQVPIDGNASVPPVVMVHTLVVAELKLTGSPELAVADSVGVVPKACGPGLAKVMV